MARPLLARLALGAALFAAAFHAALSPEVILTRRDALLLYLPLKSFIAEELRAGRLPLWLPWDGVGASVVGSLVGGLFHPGTLLLLLLSPAQALKWQVLLSYPAAALGMGLLARELGAAEPGRWLAALAYALSGYLLSMSDNLPYLLSAATLPWVLLAAERLAARPDPARVLALAGALLLSLLGGDAQALPLQSGAALAALLIRGPTRARLQAYALALGLLILFALPLAPPALALARETGRASGLPEHVLYAWSLHPLRLFELIWGPPYPPEFAVEHDLASRYLGGYLTTFWAVQIPLATAAVLAALCAPLRSRTGALYGGGALLGLLLALGPRAGLLPLLVKLAPPLAGFRYPEKYLPYALLGLCALAALGASRLDPRRLLGFAGLSLALVVLASPGHVEGLLIRLDPDPVETGLAEALADGIRRQALVGVGLALLLLGTRRWTAWAAPALAFVQALSWVPTALALGPASALEQGSPLAAPAVAAAGGGRLCWYVDSLAEGLSSQGLARAQVYTLFLPLNVLWHLGSLRGYTPGYPLALHEACPESAGCPTPCSRRLGASVGLVEASRFQPAEGLRELVRDPLSGTVLFADARARPPVALVGTRHAPDEAAARRLFSDPGTPLDQAVLVGSGEDLPAPRGEVRSSRPSPGRLEVEARLEGPGLILAAQACAKGWRAELDGRPVEPVTADLGLCAVRAEAGAHRLVLSYRPPGWPWAWLGPLLGLGLAAYLLRRASVT